MKILHVSNYFYPHIGGIEQTAKDIVESLADGAEQRLICFNAEKSDCKEQVSGIEVTRCGTALRLSSQAISFRFKKELKKLFREWNPDLVVFHYPNPFEAHYLLKQLKKHRNCKLILWWHLDIVKQKILGKFFNGQNKRLLKRAARIVATSPNYVEGSKFLRSQKDKCTVIPSCIASDRTVVNEAAAEHAESIRAENADKTILFAIGRHVPYKGMEYLIHSSKLLDDKFRVFIGGEGPLTQELKALAEGDEKITFLGRLSDDDVKAYMSACDIYCFPSVTKNEAFGLALAEAMSFAKPAVTFTIEGSGVNYVSLNGVTGLEAENCNVEKYAEAIRTLAEDDALRASMGEAARERVGELFSEERFARKVTELVRDVCGNGALNGKEE